LAAVNNYPDALMLIDLSEDSCLDESAKEDICLAAVKRDGCAIRHVDGDYQTQELCLAAVKQDKTALKYIRTDNREKYFESKNKWYSLWKN